MSLETKISVIIPAYNSALYIAQTLESVVNQTFLDFEVIVINDGSSDNTQEVVETWQKKDVRIKCYQKANGGVSSARNLGIEKASGVFITFLDSDDTWEQTFLEKMYAGITSGNNNLAWCGFRYKIAETVKNNIPTSFNVPDLLLFIINKEWISTDSWMIRKDFLTETDIKFTTGFHHREDFEFFCKLVAIAEKSTISCIPEYLSNYNLHGGSLSQQEVIWFSMENIIGSLKAYKSLYYFLCQKEKRQEAYIKAIAQKIKKQYLYWLWGTLLLGNRKDFRLLLAQYCREDMPIRKADIKSEKINYRIWELITTTPVIRDLGRYLFIPYKYFQRKYRMFKLKQIGTKQS